MSPVLPSVVYAREARIPAPKDRTPRAIRRLIDAAFRAGVQEGRSRERRLIERDNSGPFPRVDYGMFSRDD